ncbi:LysR substrate-binding domain-containing protein [Pelagibacterium sp.]|uniref:LysR substrate-binding domain-containing protein n=1 Tax=Pelagibacterium sp. TaxID=1967288 RepID=UPI003A9532C7
MVRPLNFSQIQAFKAVIETGTTTSAASLLNTTQPSISRKLSDFQRATRLKLFEHHRGRLRPTREGQQLYESVRRHFEGLEKIETAVGVLRKSGAGVLRVGSTPTLASGLLPRVFNRFLDQFPGTFVGLQTLPTDQLAELLMQNLIDLAVTTGKVDPSKFESLVIATTSAVCIVPPDHPLAQQDWVSLEDLAKHRMILLNDSDDMVIRLREFLRGLGAQENTAIETNSSITICALVASGVGVGVVNPFIAHAMSQDMVIKELRPSIRVDVSLVHPLSLAPSLLGEAFTTLLIDMIDPDERTV